MSESVEAAVARCLYAANQKFDAAMNALVPGAVPPPPSPAEQLGRMYRDLSDGINQFMRGLAKGWNYRG